MFHYYCILYYCSNVLSNSVIFVLVNLFSSRDYTYIIYSTRLCIIGGRKNHLNIVKNHKKDNFLKLFYTLDSNNLVFFNAVVIVTTCHKLKCFYYYYDISKTYKKQLLCDLFFKCFMYRKMLINLNSLYPGFCLFPVWFTMN